MSQRPLLDAQHISPAAAERMARFHADVVGKVSQAVSAHPVVVVGMAQNPHVRRARRLLDEAGVRFEYLEYGSYFSAWKERLAIKLWSGWPTFPQVFVNGSLIGGADQADEALKSGALKA